jgi:phosphate butyryltransferase
MLMQTFSKFRKMEVNMKSLKELLNFKTNKKVRIAVACPEDYEVLSAIFEAYELDMGLFSLFGNVSKIKSIAQEIGKDIPSDFLLVDATDGQLACQLAVKAVSQGEAQILMKGLIDTSVILKEALNKEYGIRTDKILSHVMVCELPFLNRLVLLSDGAMIIDPSVPQLKEITMNAVELAKALGFARPKVAVLSAVEKINPKMPSTLKAQELRELWEKGEIPDCELYGPLAVDGALSLEAARIKKIESPVAGRADILIVPFIEVGNALYKGWMFGCSGPKSAGIIMGAKAPIVLTSRADSHEAKLYSIALAIKCL